ncbi:MAG: zinc-dependent alcohol dehydrogenase family protein [Acidimicrobiaceae bacterium]|nr:zinc-dependent alcohol dehydrogenase family protein [Acidimicrobiaceae bacterium]
MRGVVLHAPGEIRVEDLPDPAVLEPGDAVLRLEATCVCGSDLWRYRGEDPFSTPQHMGHEYVGVVEEIGSSVHSLTPGDRVVGSFFASDNSCEICAAGYQSSCVHRQLMSGAQAQRLRVPLADGTLVVVGGTPDDAQLRGLLAASDVFGTGWFGARAAAVSPGKTVVVVGDGAVGLLGVLSARLQGAERIIAMSRHASRQQLALEFGATDIVAERGDEGIERVRDLTHGLGAHCVIEAVGTNEAMRQAFTLTRPGGHLGFVGVSHGVSFEGRELFMSHVHLHGGPAPVRDYLPELITRIMANEINPGRVFDLDLPLDGAAEAYRAMDERTAIKVMLRP